MKRVLIETNTGSFCGISPFSKAAEVKISIEKFEKNFRLSKLLMHQFLGLSVTNKILCDVYDSWERLKPSEERPEENSYFLILHDKMCFYLIHDLRVFVDIAISVLWIIDNLDENKIAVDGLDAYFNTKNKYQNDIVDKHKDFLGILRQIDNGHKHSLINHSDRRFGVEEPCVYGVYNNHNNYNNPSESYCVEVWRIIDSFNSFCTDFLDSINK